MCGIAGLLDLHGEASSDELHRTVGCMTGTLAHRGPDGCGTWVDAARGVALGHRRLAIVDPSPTGAQPMHLADGRYTITYNGEIYNFRELRRELAAEGHLFRGRSDTEVILSACAAWGVEGALKRLVGMFAFALWDREERSLTLARDRIGEKPLFYGRIRGTMAFASELKALRHVPGWLGTVDEEALALYFSTNYVPAPYTIYAGIQKLPPGTFLTVRGTSTGSNADLVPKPYWSLREVVARGVETPFRGTEGEASEELERILREVVRSQMVADVPLGALLSGGVDSSTVVALMQREDGQPVDTFTARFEDASHDEAPYAKAVAAHLGTRHHELLVTAADALAVIPHLPDWYDEPFADSSQIPTSLVARLARAHVTVCLTGDGGDEMFAGYNRHVQLQRLWPGIATLPGPLRRGAATLLRRLPAHSYDAWLRRLRWGVSGVQIQKLPDVLQAADIESAYLALTSFWSEAASPMLRITPRPRTTLTDRSEWVAIGDPLQRLLYVETMTSLPDDMLVKIDRASMAVGLEMRAPLIDQRVVEFAWTLPTSYKVHGARGKRVLRRVLYRHVPERLIDRPKWGFALPIGDWLRGPLRPWAEALLDESRIRQAGLLNPAIVRHAWREHLSGRREWQGRVWGMLMLQAWLERERRPIERAA